LIRIEGSQTLSITSKANEYRRKGKDIAILAAGQPDFDTPNFIKKAAIDALKMGKTKYTPVRGIPELIQAIVERYKRERDIIYKSDEIIVSCGAKQSIFNILFAILEEGDEVIIPKPYWLSYPQIVQLCRGVPVFLDTDASLKITPQMLRPIITKKTKAFILNSPNNPSGMVYTKEELVELAEIFKEYNIYVVSDEVYEKIIYDIDFFSISQVNGMQHRTFVVSGVSKSYAMTGWRLGYAAGTKEVIKNAGVIQSHTTTCAPSISQYAAVSALKNGDAEIKKMVSIFKKRRDIAVKLLEEIPDITFNIPDGAFYIFVNISSYTKDSMDLTNKLLEQGVAVIPGAPFGKDGYIRISYASSEGDIKKGIERIGKFLMEK